MRKLLAASLTIASLAMVGCLPEPVVGEDDGPDNPMDPPDDPPDEELTARQMFDADVQPALVAKCQSCHVEDAGPGNALKFLGTDMGANYYEPITAYNEVTGAFNPEIASLLLKGEHEGSQWWTATEDSAIRAWLLEELDIRGPIDGGADPTPPPGMGSTASSFAAFSGCMTLENWNLADMGSWSSKGSNGGQCAGCHQNGQALFNTAADDTEMFNMNRQYIFIVGFYNEQVNVDGTRTVVPAWDRLRFMGDGATQHPQYNTDPDDNRFVRLQTFYDLTMQEMANTNCEDNGFPAGPLAP